MIRSLQCITVAVAELLLTSSFARAQETTDLPVDWPAVESAISIDKDSVATRRFRSLNNTAIDNIHVPILVPGTGPVRSTTRVAGDSNVYSGVVNIPAANLTVMGTTRALEITESDPAAPLVNIDRATGKCDFQVSNEGDELSADCGFSRFGAEYTIRIVCQIPDDPRCTSDEFLNSVRESLIAVGGTKK
jgi:hypothetical protein